MALATAEDIATRAGAPLGATEAGTVEFLLGSASALIVDEAPDSAAAWVTDPNIAIDDVPASVRNVCVEVVYRAFSNPDAYERVTLPDLTVVYRAKDPDALFLTDNERRIVRRAAGRSSAGSLTLVTPFSGDDETTVDPLL